MADLTDQVPANKPHPRTPSVFVKEQSKAVRLHGQPNQYLQKPSWPIPRNQLLLAGHDKQNRYAGVSFPAAER